MKLYKRYSKYTDDEMRAAVMALSDEDKEKLISNLEVTHKVFENWMGAKDKLPNRNKALHLLGFKMNFEEFREKMAKAAVSGN